MSKMIQLRNVPDALHRGLKARAAMAGMSLSDYLLAEIIERRIYSRNENLHAPHLLDLEVTQVLRRLALQGVVSVHRADEAVGDLVDLRMTRYPHLMLL